MTDVQATTAEGQQPSAHKGFARAVGKWIAGIVAAVLGSVLTFVVINDVLSGSGANSTRYQNKVVGICTEDRELELKFKHKLDQISNALMPENTSAIYAIPRLMTDTIVEEQGLADGLEALVPPSDLEPVQSEAVSTWRRKLEISRGVRDQVERLAVDSAGDAVVFARSLGQLDYTEESRLESQTDVLLRKLGGSGCKPSP
jgi:hypothetical protein